MIPFRVPNIDPTLCSTVHVTGLHETPRRSSSFTVTVWCSSLEPGPERSGLSSNGKSVPQSQ